MKIIPGEGDFLKVSGSNLVVLNYMKHSIPQVYRYYDGDESCWFVHAVYLAPLVQLGFAQFGAVDYSQLPTILKQGLKLNAGKDYGVVEKAAKTEIDIAYAVLHLRPSAPRVIVDAVWRILAKEHHPDRGGDAAVFRNISEAYDKIKE